MEITNIQDRFIRMDESVFLYRPKLEACSEWNIQTIHIAGTTGGKRNEMNNRKFVVSVKTLDGKNKLEFVTEFKSRDEAIRFAQEQYLFHLSKTFCGIDPRRIKKAESEFDGKQVFVANFDDKMFECVISESCAVAAIFYIGKNGKIVDEEYFYSARAFEAAFKENNYDGVPMRVKLFKNNGAIVFHDFLVEADPPVSYCIEEGLMIGA